MEDLFCSSNKYLADSFGIQSVAEMSGKQVVIFKIIYLFIYYLIINLFIYLVLNLLLFLLDISVHAVDHCSRDAKLLDDVTSQNHVIF